jgi:hypothetical protein
VRDGYGNDAQMAKIVERLQRMEVLKKG